MASTPSSNEHSYQPTTTRPYDGISTERISGVGIPKLDFALVAEHTLEERRADPEAYDVSKVFESRLHGGQSSAMLCFDENPNHADDP